MLDPRFVFFAAIITLLGVAGYARDTLKGHTKPNRVTWTLWTVITLTTFLAQISEGVGLPAVLTLSFAVANMGVLVASFLNPKSYWKIGKFDVACGILALLALAWWAVTRDAVAAIVLMIGADLIASMPTFIKAYKFPETESANAFLFGAVGTIITLMTISDWTISAFLFPAYILMANTIMYIFIKLPDIRMATKRSPAE